MWNPRLRFKTVDDMWKESVRDEVPLLSAYPAEFWSFYRSNHVRFDALFRQMFLSFTYFLQDDSENVDTVTTNFISAVYNHLLLNHKKYDELYRLELLENTDYKFNVNYDITESYSGTTSGSHSDTIGSRSDSSSVTYGQRQDGTTNNIGSRQDSTTSNIGGRQDSTTLNKGTHTDNLEHDVSPDDDENFYNHRKDVNQYGAEQDTTNFTQGQQQDSTTFNKGAESDSTTFNKGAETDTSSATIGQQVNSGTSSGTEGHTLSKSGIVGNITPAKLLEQHVGFWRIYEFYKYIFKQISEDLLLV